VEDHHLSPVIIRKPDRRSVEIFQGDARWRIADLERVPARRPGASGGKEWCT
jgi:hypothetical protein